MTLLILLLSSIVGSASCFCPARHSRRRICIAAEFSNPTTAKSSSYLSTTGPYIRIQKRGRHYDVQTAVTSFQKKENSDYDDLSAKKTTSSVVDLHSQIHFGDASYYNYFNDDEQFGSLYDNVLYELIVEDKFLKAAANNPHLRTLMLTLHNTLNPIAPTLADRKTASQYGLQCQVDGIQYCKENWIHADFTREEFFTVLMKENNEGRTGASTESNYKHRQKQQQPLWALASTTATYPGSEAFTALLRPLTTINSASAQLTRRLFTHLFLPGDALSGWLRTILWFGVPSPELSILLVDWSSLSYIGRGKRRRQSRWGRGNDTFEDGIAPISPIAAPVLLSLLTGNWGTARRLVFGQVLVGGQSSEDASKNGVLIAKRNEHAMTVLREVLWLQSDVADTEERNKRIALLYGAGHCHDLQERLEAEGFVTVRKEWRTAFRASAPTWGDYFDVERDWTKKDVSKDDTTSDFGSSLALSQFGESVISSLSTSALESAAVGLVILPLYLLIGGSDWVSTLQDFGLALDKGQYLDGMVNMILYLVRHVVLYVGISKFIVDWGGGANGVFEEDEP